MITHTQINLFLKKNFLNADVIVILFASSVIVKALQSLKKALGLPLRIGWNGDPCVPQQYPWTGVDCEYNHKTKSWVIDGMYTINTYS